MRHVCEPKGTTRARQQRSSGVKPIAILLSGMLLLGARIASAQETARVDIFGGYTYLHGNVVVTGQGINQNGASGSASYNLNKWFGLAFDFGGTYDGKVAGTARSLTLTTYLFGPRFSLKKNEKFSPFAQVLFGGGHAGGTLYTGGTNPLGTQNSFAMAGGGGVDWNLRPRIGLRVFQAEFLRTQFNNGVNFNQNSFRLSSGVVFHLGKK